MDNVYIKPINYLSGQKEILQEFFKSADVYGRKNKASYREFELALQEELTLEQKYRNCKYYTK